MVDRVWRDHLARIRPDADPAEAQWWDTTWEPGTTPPAVGFLIPRGFAAYARVFHPAGREDDAGTAVSWATVAEACGTTMHPQAQWLRLAGNLDLDPHGRPEVRRTWTGREPDQGRLDRPQLEALAEVLARHTSTPERTIVGFWVGYGVWPMSWDDASTRRPVSEWYVFERPLVDVPTLCAEAPAVQWALGDPGGTVSWRSDGVVTAPSEDELFEMWAPHEWQSPSAWWPADHAWAMSSDIDHDSTLVGGPRALVEELLADDRLEVLRFPADGSL